MGRLSYERLLEQARECIGVSDKARWRLAELTAKAVDLDSARRWAEDTELTRRQVQNYLILWERYGKNRVPGQDFSDHLALARRYEDDAAEIAAAAVDSGSSVREVISQRRRAKAVLKTRAVSVEQSREQQLILAVREHMKDAEMCLRLLGPDGWRSLERGLASPLQKQLSVGWNDLCLAVRDTTDLGSGARWFARSKRAAS